jgi:hypothetical protein
VTNKPPQFSREMQIAMELAGIEISLHHGGATVHALDGIVATGIEARLRELANHADHLAATSKPKAENIRAFKLHHAMTQLSVDGSRAASEAAMLIYAHAILDAVVYKICKIAASIDQRPWLVFVGDKNIKFQEVRSSAVRDLEQKFLGQYFLRLERESLIFKCDALFRVLSGVRTRGVLKGFRYSRDRLLDLDHLRHDLVHKLKFHRRFRQAKAKVNYLFSTGHFFHNLILRHYKLRTIFEIPQAEKTEPIAGASEGVARGCRRSSNR